MNVTKLISTNDLKQTEAYKEHKELFRKTVESAFYSQCIKRLKLDAGDEHVLFEEKKPKMGVMGDKTLAEAAGFKEDFEIGWESESTGTMTADQLKELREKYDAESMTEKEYKGLLQEMMDMQMLSASGVKRRPMKSKKEEDYARYLVDMIQQNRII